MMFFPLRSHLLYGTYILYPFIIHISFILYISSFYIHISSHVSSVLFREVFVRIQAVFCREEDGLVQAWKGVVASF